MFTDVHSGFPRFISVAWFPVKVKIFDGGAVPWKKRTVDTSDGAERKRNQKYGANRVERNSNRAMENRTTLALTQCSMTYMCALTIRSW